MLTRSSPLSIWNNDSPNTISAMESKGAETLTSGLDTIRAISKALEAAGGPRRNHFPR
jgi:hypothetical protein